MDSIITRMTQLSVNSSDDDIADIFETLSIQKYLKVINGNDNVQKVLDGQNLTKKIRNKKKANMDDFFVWNIVTHKRYKGYLTFIDDSYEDFQDICNNIIVVNNMFDNFKTDNRTKLIELVHKNDKKLIKLFKDWNLVK